MKDWAQHELDFSGLAGLGGRFALSVLLTLSFSGVAIIAAWSLYVFFGATSWNLWFWTRVSVAGLGAGLGAYLAWMVATVPKPSRVSVAIVIVIILAAILGGWIGYHWGGTQEVACCARPRTSSMAYTIFGSMVGANLSSMVLGVYSQIKWRLPPPPQYIRAQMSGGSPR